jgi:hypothetical protein
MLLVNGLGPQAKMPVKHPIFYKMAGIFKLSEFSCPSFPESPDNFALLSHRMGDAITISARNSQRTLVRWLQVIRRLESFHGFPGLFDADHSALRIFAFLGPVRFKKFCVSHKDTKIQRQRIMNRWAHP